MVKTASAPHPIAFLFIALAALLATSVPVGIVGFIFWSKTPPPVTEVSPPPAPHPSTAIIADIERIVGASPEREHVISALFAPGGTMEIVFAIRANTEWTGAFREELADTISAAMRRGAIQFQLIAVSGDPGTVVER